MGNDATRGNSYFQINFKQYSFGEFLEGGPDIQIKVFNSSGSQIYELDKIQGAPGRVSAILEYYKDAIPCSPEMPVPSGF